MPRHAVLACLISLMVPVACGLAGPEQDLVDVRALEPTILVDLRFYNGENFLKARLYDVNVALLRRPAAMCLARVQRALREQGLGLRILDAYRPHSVQVKMWRVRPDRRFVAHPGRGSHHGRAMAVDVALVDMEGHELDMGSGASEFSQRSYPNARGIGAEAREHRQILTRAMRAQGFSPAQTEWWHFNAPGCRSFKVLDVPLAQAAAQSPYRPTSADVAKLGVGTDESLDPWGDGPDDLETDGGDSGQTFEDTESVPSMAPSPGPLWHLLGPVSEAQGPLK